MSVEENRKQKRRKRSIEEKLEAEEKKDKLRRETGNRREER